MTEAFIEKTFRADSQKWVGLMVSICKSYAARGFRLSLRQVYYQLVAHHGLPNREQSYKNMGSLLSEARMAGLVDWSLIEDRNRETLQNPHWLDEADFLSSVAKQYKIDLWEDQSYHVEVMIEKSALEGVLAPVCRGLDIPFTSNRGYSSSSAMYETGKRLERKLNEGRKVVIVYLGDHDPSGIDMTRDVYERLGLFSGVLYYPQKQVGETPKLEFAEYEDYENSFDDDPETLGCPRFRVRRIALTMEQIRQYNPPPNPAKLTDSRASSYIRQYGPESWELDALAPEVLAALVVNEVEEYLDRDRYEDRRDLMLSGRLKFEKIAEKFRLGEELGEEPEEE